VNWADGAPSHLSPGVSAFAGDIAATTAGVFSLIGIYLLYRLTRRQKLTDDASDRTAAEVTASPALAGKVLEVLNRMQAMGEELTAAQAQVAELRHQLTEASEELTESRDLLEAARIELMAVRGQNTTLTEQLATATRAT
jgi:chromosome segregation ATPase